MASDSGLSIPDPDNTENDRKDAGPTAGRAFSASRSAAIIGVAFIVSRILGLGREVLLGYRFGTSGEYDAYVAAFRIPDLLFLVIMSGAFGAAFIPVFGGFLASGREREAWRLASAVITLTALASAVLAVVCAILAGPLVRYVVAPDLPTEIQPIAVSTMRVLLLSPILLGLGIAAKGILEAQDQFTLPALSPVVYNLAIIIAAIVLAPIWGVTGVAVGVVVGAGLHVAVQLPGLLKSRMDLAPVLSTQVEGLREVGRLLLPRVIGLAAFQINFIAMTNLASRAGEGRVSALNYAWQMLMLPHGVIALSISTVIFPTMAREFERGRMDAVRSTFTRALMPLIFLSVPASIGLYELRTVLPQTVFQLGAFDARSTALVSPALGFLAIGLIWYAIVEVLTRVFYAMKDTLTPVVAGITIIVINIVLGIVLLDPLGHVGLALALSASTGIEALILFFVLRRRIGGLDESFGPWIGRVLIAAAVMAMLAEAIRPMLEEATLPGEAPRVIQLLLLALAMAALGGTYFVAAWYLRLPEVVTGVAALKRRFGQYVRWPKAR